MDKPSVPQAVGRIKEALNVLDACEDLEYNSKAVDALAQIEAAANEILRWWSRFGVMWEQDRGETQVNLDRGLTLALKAALNVCK